jgi:hypothetical protein
MFNQHFMTEASGSSGAMTHKTSLRKPRRHDSRWLLPPRPLGQLTYYLHLLQVFMLHVVQDLSSDRDWQRVFRGLLKVREAKKCLVEKTVRFRAGITFFFWHYCLFCTTIKIPWII